MHRVLKNFRMVSRTFLKSFKKRDKDRKNTFGVTFTLFGSGIFLNISIPLQLFNNSKLTKTKIISLKAGLSTFAFLVGIMNDLNTGEN